MSHLSFPARRIASRPLVIGTILAVTLGCQSSGFAEEPSSPHVATPGATTAWNIRGKLATGTRIVERMKMRLNEGKMTITVPQAPEPLQAIFDMTVVVHEEMHVLDGKDGDPTRLRINHLEETTTVTTRFAGKAETKTEKGELDGREELAVLESGTWKRTLIGEPATKAQAKELQTPPLERDHLPTSAKIGDTWDLEGLTLRRYLGAGDILDLEGKITDQLVAVERKGGEDLATITSGGSFKARMLDDDNEVMEVEMNLDLTTVRSLTKGYDLSSRGKGTMAFSTAKGRPGPSIRVVGRVTIEVTAEPVATVAAQ